MAAERFMRPAAFAKNMLGGDENKLMIHQHQQLNVKQQALLNYASSTTMTTTMGSSQEMLMSKTSVLTSSTTSLLASVAANARNALGDIGNKFGMAAASSQSSSQPLAAKPSSQQPVVDNVDMLERSNVDYSMKEELEEYEEEDDESEFGDVVLDIDEYDTENTQACADYVKDIYKYMFELEAEYMVPADFLAGKVVTAKMRSVLVDWLIQVHLKFNLLTETLYLCVHIIDSYLMLHDVPKLQLQLVGVTALLVACKYEEMIVPTVADFAFMTDNTYSDVAIRAMEIAILKSRNFMLCKPNALNFLRRFSKAGDADAKQHTMAKYLMELTLHDSEFSAVEPSFLAACALCLSLRCLNGIVWNQQLEYYTNYKEKTLLPVMQKMAILAIRALEPEYRYKAVTNKFRQSKFMRIACAPELSGAEMRSMAVHCRFMSE